MSARVRSVLLASVVLAAGLLVVPAPAVAAASGSSSGLVVRTDTGAVRGKRADGVDSFLGIPYAAPPVGRLRWQPPRRHARWSGVRDAQSYGARCAALESTNGARSDSENCLFVNVQRPARASGRHLPVYVFIHGGGLVNGSSNQAGGGKIVRRSNAIVVTMNYRLGVFGYLGLPGLSARGEGNYGFLDQQASLRWVQRNIARFGGDPHRVTIGGESAGGWSVCGHLIASRGLFQRAMIQSGSCTSQPLSDTRANSRDFEAAAGCSTVACLRRQPAASLLDASASFTPTMTSGTSVFRVPTQTSLRRGDFARVPVVNGSNRDEGRTFAQGFIGSTRAEYTAWARETFGTDASRVLARYPWPSSSTKFTAAYLIGAIQTDAGLVGGIGGCKALQTTQLLARRVPTHAYEFAARRGPGLTPLPGYVWGAGHAAELAYLFPSFDNGTPIAPTFDAGERQLSREIIDRWTSFAFTGRPTAPGLVAWPRYDRTTRLLSLRPGGRTTTISTAAYRSEHNCDFWSTVDIPDA